jgi:hypothetical protein
LPPLQQQQPEQQKGGLVGFTIAALLARAGKAITLFEHNHQTKLKVVQELPYLIIIIIN